MSILVEFTKYGDYNLIVDGTHLTAGDDLVGQMKYKVEPTQNKNEFGILLYDGKSKEEYSRLSAIFTKRNQELTPILFWKDEAIDQVALTRFSLGS